MGVIGGYVLVDVVVVVVLVPASARSISMGRTPRCKHPTQQRRQHQSHFERSSLCGAALAAESDACNVESKPRFGLGETCNTAHTSFPATRGLLTGECGWWL